MSHQAVPAGAARDETAAAIEGVADRMTKRNEARITTDPVVQEILNVVLQFIQDHCLVLYGGTALNETLCNELQFYDRGVDMADYDFFSDNAAALSRELVDLFYHQCGFGNVSMKAGMHPGTYKVSVNMLPVADITQMDTELFDTLRRTAHPQQISIFRVLIPSTEWLRVDLYKELMMPQGDVSRWKKVWLRMQLINEYEDLLRAQGKLPRLACKQNASRPRSALVEKLSGVIAAFAKRERQPVIGGVASTVWMRQLNALVPKQRAPMLSTDVRVRASDQPLWEFLSTDPQADAQKLMRALASTPGARLDVLHVPAGEWERSADMSAVLLLEPERQVLAEFVSSMDACESVVDIGPYTLGSLSTLLYHYHTRLFDTAAQGEDDALRVRCVIDTLARLQVALATKYRTDGNADTSPADAFVTERCFGEQHTIADMRDQRQKRWIDTHALKPYLRDVEDWNEAKAQQYMPYLDDVSEHMVRALGEGSTAQKGARYVAHVRSALQHARDAVDAMLAKRRGEWTRTYRALIRAGAQLDRVPACQEAFCKRPENARSALCTQHARAAPADRPCGAGAARPRTAGSEQSSAGSGAQN